jgi:phosphoribosylaminoimidazole-succinocarboxamide synthase
LKTEDRRIVIVENEFLIPGFEPFKKGKVRDLYNVPDPINQQKNRKDLMLSVTTDRVSVNDQVVGNVPGRGIVLNKISIFWKNYFSMIGIIPNDIYKTDTNDILSYFGHKIAPKQFRNRVCLVKKVKNLPYEFIVRGRMKGSLEKEYNKNNRQAGWYLDNFLPAGLCEGEELSQPVFTPTTKSENGHDQSINFKTLALEIGYDKAYEIKKTSLLLYFMANKYLLSRGIALIDTKFEFGYDQIVSGLDGSTDSRLVLIDEVLTPDSSRFYFSEPLISGCSLKEMSKQYIRDELNRQNDLFVSKPIQRETMKRYRRVMKRTLSNKPFI